MLVARRKIIFRVIVALQYLQFFSILIMDYDAVRHANSWRSSHGRLWECSCPHSSGTYEAHFTDMHNNGTNIALNEGAAECPSRNNPLKPIRHEDHPSPNTIHGAIVNASTTSMRVFISNSNQIPKHKIYALNALKDVKEVSWVNILHILTHGDYREILRVNVLQNVHPMHWGDCMQATLTGNRLTSWIR